MVGGCRLSACRLPDKYRQMIGQQISWTKCADPAARARHSRRSRQMALLANAIAAGRLEQILDDFECAPLRVYALLPARRLMPIKVRIFLDTLELMSKSAAAAH